MSCNCTCEPGCCGPYCGPCCTRNKGYLVITPESLPVQLSNLITSLFGAITYHLEGGRVVWDVPCGTNYENPSFPRNAGEGLLCYLIRIYGMQGVQNPRAPASLSDFSMFPGGTPPTTGFYITADNLNIYTLKGGDTVWFATPR